MDHDVSNILDECQLHVIFIVFASVILVVTGVASTCDEFCRC
jgi:hypothetical protein